MILGGKCEEALPYLSYTPASNFVIDLPKVRWSLTLTKHKTTYSKLVTTVS